jgi:protein-tyrosine-phosphatase/DNA-binding transcriptional ArsR family regulator
VGPELRRRAAVFAALGEPIRLAVVDQLLLGDVSPGRLATELRLGSNLMAHHLTVLEEVGVIRRVPSEGDGRRSYIHLRIDDPVVWAAAQGGRAIGISVSVQRVLFVCTANSARSQLAAAAWNSISSIPANSAGTHPARRIHPRALAVARRHGLELLTTHPSNIDDVRQADDLIVAVCDNAYEEMGTAEVRLHWSIPDPVRQDTDAAFEGAYSDLRRRVHHLAASQTDPRKAS